MGPIGYEYVDYYYLPDIDTYYDVRTTQFIYLNNGNWKRSKYLPRHHRNYNLNNGYKVVLNNYHGKTPYYNYKYDKKKYYKGYRGTPQRMIGLKNSKFKKSYNNSNKGNDNHKGNKGKGKD